MISHYGQLNLEFSSNPEMVTYTKSMFSDGTIGSVAFPDELEQRIRPNVLQSPIEESSWKLVADRLGLDPASTTYADLYTAGIPEDGLLTAIMHDRYLRVLDNVGSRLLGRVLHMPHSRMLAAALHSSPNDLNLIEPSEESSLVDSVESFLPEILAEPELRVVDLSFGLSDWKRRDPDTVAADMGMTTGEVSRIREKSLSRIASSVHRGAIKRYIPTPKKSFASELGYRTIAEIPELAEYDIYDHLDHVEEREERHSRLGASLPFVNGSGTLMATLLHDRSEYLDPEVRTRIVNVIHRSIRSNPVEVGFGSLVARAVEEDENIEADAAFGLYNQNFRYDDSLDRLDDLLRKISQI